MTLVAIHKTPDHAGFTAFADSMLSTLHSSPLTKGAPKLLTLPFLVYNEHSKVIYRRTFGFAYAGSSLVANAVFGFCVSALQSMRLSSGGRIPGLDEISKFVAVAAKNYIEEVAVTQTTGAVTEIAVFGFCPRTEGLRLFKAQPMFDPEFSMGFGEMDVSKPGVIHFLGNSKAIDFFAGKIAEGVKEIGLIFSEAIASEDLKEVGGSLQVLRVDKRGARSLPVLQAGDDGAIMTLLGKRLEELSPVGDCHFRHEAWGVI